MDNFVHLHVHSEASVLDGVSKIKELVQAAKKNGMKSLAITEHGHLNSSLKFYNACVKEGIKPIIGCEMYQSEFIGQKNREGKRIDKAKNHLVVLAKNLKGWQNLLKLNHLSYSENNFYYKPTISFGDLIRHKEGLIVSSACLGSMINRMILSDRLQEAEKIIQALSHEFKDDFYLEIQLLEKETGQNKANKHLIDFANKLGIKMILTSDVHYVSKKDWKLQEMVYAIRAKLTYEQINKKRKNMVMTKESFFHTAEDYYEANERLGYNYSKEFIQKCFKNSIDISDKINFIMPKEKHYPNFKITEDLSKQWQVDPTEKTKLLAKICLKGLKSKLEKEEIDKKKLPIYQNKLKHEIELIKKMNYVDYFLIVWDIMQFCEREKIRRGVARGSVGGSLIAFLSGITDLDPVRWNTILERFISTERSDYPDIDLDFDRSKRDRVYNFLSDKYKNLVHIRISQCFGVKNTLRDFARVNSWGVKEVALVDKICKSFGDAINVTPKDLKNYIEKTEKLLEQCPKLKTAIKVVEKLFGNTRSSGEHPAGVCITDKPISEILPITKSKNMIVSAYTEGEERELSEINVIKFDILGLKTLAVIDRAVELIGKSSGEEESKKVSDDLSHFKWINNHELIKELIKDNTGVFQFDSNNLWKFSKEVKPTSFENLVDCTALFRPDILKSGQASAYIKRKLKKEQPPKEMMSDENIRDIVGKTHYCFVYQEQVMYLLHRVFGLSMAEANVARKYISKKKPEKLRTMINEKISSSLNKEKFIHEKEKMEKLIDMLLAFGGYSFNYAHSVAYTLLSMQCLYLRTYYKTEFMTALINQKIGQEDELYRCLHSARQLGIEILPIDINKSKWEFVVEDKNKLRAGFKMIKGLSFNSFEEIQSSKKEKGDFLSFDDFLGRNLKRNALNKLITKSLISVGVFDSINNNRKQINKIYKNSLEKKPDKKKIKKNLTGFLFESFKKDLEEKLQPTEVPDVEDYTSLEKSRYEKTFFGFVFFADLFKSVQKEINALITKGIYTNLKDKGDGGFIVVFLEKQKTVKSRKGTTLHFLTVVDPPGNKEEILMFNDKYQSVRPKPNNHYRLNFSHHKDHNNIERFNIKTFSLIESN